MLLDWLFIAAVFLILLCFWIVGNWTADLISKAYAARSVEDPPPDGEQVA